MATTTITICKRVLTCLANYKLTCNYNTIGDGLVGLDCTSKRSLAIDCSDQSFTCYARSVSVAAISHAHRTPIASMVCHGACDSTLTCGNYGSYCVSSNHRDNVTQICTVEHFQDCVRVHGNDIRRVQSVLVLRICCVTILSSIRVVTERCEGALRDRPNR